MIQLEQKANNSAGNQNSRRSKKNDSFDNNSNKNDFVDNIDDIDEDEDEYADEDKNGISPITSEECVPNTKDRLSGFHFGAAKSTSTELDGSSIVLGKSAVGLDVEERKRGKDQCTIS